jgi:UDP-N-acetylmuramoyl-tripeptide--D-alanyl-D-alanine ligase
MMAWRLSELVRYSPGQIVGNDCAFNSVSTDSRSLAPGALFVALSGPSFDGHDFVAAAAERGAAAALVERPLAAQIPQLVTRDPLGALSAFAREWRRQFHIPLIGVTGSNGKTTTKELIGSILSQQGKTLITRGNLNNHIGVPLMLLELTAEHRFAVIEMGANHIGEIAHLASLAEPTVGIVTTAAARRRRDRERRRRVRRAVARFERGRSRADVRLRAAGGFHGAQGARAQQRRRLPH